METNSSSYTILRIKRKRDEEVPGVLVIDSAAKKDSKRRKAGLDVFQFAETVSESAWNKLHDEELRSRISALQRSVPGSRSKRRVDEVTLDTDTLSRQASTQSTLPARQYRVLPQGASQNYKRSSSRPTIPPKVMSARDLERASSNIKIYDAVLDNPEPETLDPEMDKFQSMLQEYLTMRDNAIPSHRSVSSISTSVSSIPSTVSSNGEYVYDIFYARPSTMTEKVAAAHMAIVTGLPIEKDDDDEYSSGSEIEDEADEDSNAEDYYRNDYPEGESDEDSDVDSELYSDSEDDFADDARFEPDN
ncbi:hypothetical protein PNOK_0727400 [Pyrrhoderma noxium]|uniref:Probable RNA polymerase II nuclear localization protein SLC7A6OS n=1 Tax=Pyrrhoderma noxium TaxID=2282107 RepID=A0A286UCA5_9AGAM|nr:hypothetical protein PNOK_0727400 [Pyrrhoderma noxium]